VNGGTCSSCGAVVGWAEPDPCGACNEVSRWHAAATDRLYQVLCQFDVRPARIADLHRVAKVESADGVSYYGYAVGTANIYLPQDPRFCWAGRGIYGLARDGLLSGPRNLAEVAVLVLCAAEAAQTPDRLEFVMKRMGYRFELSSLVNAMARTTWFKPQRWGGVTWDVNRGRDARNGYRVAIDHRWPTRRFESDLEQLTDRVAQLLEERAKLGQTPPDLSHLDDGWQPGFP
jgi:hypothetical protein